MDTTIKKSHYHGWNAITHLKSIGAEITTMRRSRGCTVSTVTYFSKPAEDKNGFHCTFYEPFSEENVNAPRVNHGKVRLTEKKLRELHSIAVDELVPLLNS